MENCKEIPGFPGYLVCPDGRIFGCRTNAGFRASYRELKTSRDAKGYLGLTLCGDHRSRRKVRVHRLVAELFIQNPEGKPCVRHLDGSRDNNAAANLAWGTYVENENDKRLHGTYEARRTGKLSPEARSLVPVLFQGGTPIPEIAKRFGVCRQTIGRLLNGRTWA